MSESKPVSMRCPHCGREALLLRKPRYEGFTRVGEELRCSACGGVIESEEGVSFERQAAPQLFGEEDRPRAVDLFGEEDRPRFCRHCTHYVVNPFRQWCGRHRREVEATDTCPQFEEREEPEEEAPPAH